MASRAIVRREQKARDLGPSSTDHHGDSIKARTTSGYIVSYACGYLLGLDLFHGLRSAPLGQQRNLPVLGGFLRLWLTFAGIQLATNYGRQVENLPLSRFRWFPVQRKPPIPSTSQLKLQAQSEGNFFAMELRPFGWNRFYNVFISNDVLCGARARFNVLTNPWGVARSLSLDPVGYVKASTPAVYEKIDVTKPKFIERDFANFQLPLHNVSKIEFHTSDTVKQNSGFGLGALRQSGSLLFKMTSGVTRELILLGDQDGPTLKERFEKYIDGTP